MCACGRGFRHTGLYVATRWLTRCNRDNHNPRTQNRPTTNETQGHQSTHAPLIIITRRRLYHKVEAKNLNPHYLVIRSFCASSGTSGNHKRIAFLPNANIEQRYQYHSGKPWTFTFSKLPYLSFQLNTKHYNNLSK